MNILKISNVEKSFGDKKIIDRISFSVPENCIYGFIGENGAGKTTTMKMILGLMKIDSGEICVCDKLVSFGQNETNSFIGYLPDVPQFYDYMTPKEYLVLCGNITGMSKKEAGSRADELLELVGLSNENKRIKGFSRGMKQRLGVAQALFNKPKLLICDEPTSALDPVGRKEILDILVRVKDETTVIFSTHILSDVEKICDKIAFLHDGKIVLEGNLEEIKAKNNRSDYSIEFKNQSDMSKFIKVYPVKNNSSSLKVVYDKQTEKDIFDKMNYMCVNQICPEKFEKLEVQLEDLFMEVVAK